MTGLSLNIVKYSAESAMMYEMLCDENDRHI